MLALMLVVGGCSSKLTDPTPATIEPAAAAMSPVPTRAPAGEVLAVGGRHTAALFDPMTSSLVVLTPGADPQAPATVTIVGPADGTRPVTLGSAATAIVGDGRGVVYAAIRGGFSTVDLSTGTVTATAIDGEANTDFTAIAHRADGSMVLGSAGGAIVIVDTEQAVTSKTEIFARVDAIVIEGDTAVVLDRGQTSVTALNKQGALLQALRAGIGATTIAADTAGRVLVVDTRGGQLLVFSVDPLIQRQGYPVSGKPYGIVGSQTLIWVSETANNAVVGYDLATGIPVEKMRYPTVRQPDSLAFDEITDTLYVVSGSGDGIQVIRKAAGAT
jgi:sugar lactone lactonase YvrE